MVRHRRTAALATAFLAAATSACSGGSIPMPKPVEQRLVVTARDYSFEPATLRVSSGISVTIRVKSGDKRHGLAIPALGLSAVAPARGETTLRFTPRRKGLFAITCPVDCGPGCRNMRGTLEVR